MREIHYDVQKHREADIQAWLLAKLYKIGIESHLEYKIDSLRVDVAIVKNGKIICVVEVKDTNRPAHEEMIKTKQYKQYSSLGIPFFYCFGYSEINETVKQVTELYKNTDQLAPTPPN